MNKECPVIKNNTYSLEITTLGSKGEGIGRIDGYTLFVPGGLPGDKIMVKVVKTKKNYGFGIITDIVEPSKNRVEARCPVAKQCGGCSLMHLDYKSQLDYKHSQIKDSLHRIGGIELERLDRIMEPIIGALNPYHYRNKVQYPVRDVHGKIAIGFYAKGSHRVVETPRCYIQDIYNETIVDVIRQFMIDNQVSAYNELTHKGLVRHIVIRKSAYNDKFQVTLVINGKRFPQVDQLTKIIMKLEKVESFSLNINRESTNVIFGHHLTTLEGPKYLEDNIKDVKYRISPLSFYQVNPSQTVKLYEKALEYAELTGQEIVYDLYCGIGTISLFLAQKAKMVHGVEIVGAAIDDARENAKLNAMDNVFFYTGRSEEVMPRLYEDQGIKADVVVLDPPRKGCDEKLLKAISDMSPQKIVYVSCDPGTLARDVKYFEEHDYQVKQVCGVDMFSHSSHVECVVSMVKQVKFKK